MATVFESPFDLKDSVDKHLGYSEWHEMTQERVNLFADATGDYQWIHTDPERAASGPFGGPIAHGYLTLSLLPMLMPEILQVRGIAMAVNYGSDRVRFTAPVPVGGRVRAGATVTKYDDVKGGVQVTTRVVVEVEGKDRPAAVIDSITRYYPPPS